MKGSVFVKQTVDKKNTENDLLNYEPEYNVQREKVHRHAGHGIIMSKKIKSFLKLYIGFFTKNYWVDIINRIYLSLFQFYIIKRLLFIFPLMSVALFTISAFRIRFGWFNILAALFLTFYALKDTETLSVADCIPNTFLAIGSIISGIKMIYFPIILIMGIFIFIQASIHWAFISDIISKKYSLILLIISIAELILSAIVSLSGITNARFSIFIYGLSFAFFFLPQIIRHLLYLPFPKGSSIASKLYPLRKFYEEKCSEIENDYQSLYSDEDAEYEGVFEETSDSNTESFKGMEDIDEFESMTFIQQKSVLKSDYDNRPSANSDSNNSDDLDLLLSEEFNMDFLGDDY